MKDATTPCSRFLQIPSYVCKWFWGFSDDPCPPDVQCCCGCFRVQIPPSHQPAVTEETINIAPVSLQQKRSVKICLYIGLIFIVSITVFLYCFFSLYFGTISRGPIRLLGNATSAEVVSAIEKLKGYDMI